MWQMVRAAEKHLTNLQCLFFRFNLAEVLFARFSPFRGLTCYGAISPDPHKTSAVADNCSRKLIKEAEIRNTCSQNWVGERKTQYKTSLVI